MQNGSGVRKNNQRLSLFEIVYLNILLFRIMTLGKDTRVYLDAGPSGLAATLVQLSSMEFGGQLHLPVDRLLK